MKTSREDVATQAATNGGAVKSAQPTATPAHQDHGAVHGSLFALTLGSLGVVYGDIGTSPLYALKECFGPAHHLTPTPENVLGVLSLIFWALIIVVTIKYIIFILRADNKGEGGILALTALASPIRRMIRLRRPWLVLLGVFGAALLYGDGVITPAISVLSAVEGVKVAAPSLSPFVIPITILILIGLFAIQRSGTARVGQMFGPVMIVWFSVLGVLGIVNILRQPSVLQAINPLHALDFFVRNGHLGFLILGTVFLAVTGGEALYADMGHFGAKPIRIAWFSLVLPTLILNYFGQGALILQHPEYVESPLYLMAPTWALYPMVALATMATIIASQALISGVFSITMQAEHLGFLPRVKIIHTSADAHGQIYIPFINWLLLVACIIVVLVFESSSNLAAAYGVAVTSTMAITTILFSVVARERWHWPLPVVVVLTAGFLIVDSAFLIANLLKVPQGGWFPLVVAVIIFMLMTTWKRGNELVFSREQHWEAPLNQLIERIRKQQPNRAPGTAVFLSARPAGAPSALLANLKYNNIVHERVLLTTVQTDHAPYIDEEERISIEPLAEGLSIVHVRYGFMERPDVPAALSKLSSTEHKLNLDEVPYFVNKTRVIATKFPGMALWREKLYSLLRANTSDPADFFCLPPTQIFEIGTRIEV